MRCANCGKEFGEGVNCQFCGIDRVIGLGNFSGYENPNSNNGYDTLNHGESNSTKTTVCYACKEIIPADSKFCPYCRKELWVKCPNCGHIYSSQYPNCNQCGTNLAQYLKERERIEKEKEAEEERKRKEKEAEANMKLEAIQLRNDIYSSGSTAATCIFIAVVLILLFILLTSIYTDFAILWFFLFLLPCFFLPLFGGSIDETKIDKWKKEHPNDPRCKYL